MIFPILQFISWPAFIGVSFLIIWKLLQRYEKLQKDDNSEE
ncbi:MAG: hypothetical protein RIS47_1015 [Bacteroidota bacterium]|jgi:hypothetical protein